MKKIFIIFTMLYMCPLQAEWFDRFFQRAHSFTVLIDAGGDAIHGGRIIDNNYESSINFTIAQSLKNTLEKTHSGLKILLNRTPTETISLFQNAQFANKLGIDLYVHICSVKTPSASSITLYHYSYNQKIILKKGCLGFYSYDEISLLHEQKTAEWAHMIKKILLDQKYVSVFGVYKMPFKPLMGVNAPAFAIEVGIHTMDDMSTLIDQLYHAFTQLLLKI